MALEKLTPYFPWRTDKADMRWNVLLMCKLLVVLLVLNGFPSKITDPYLPHLAFFRIFEAVPNLFKYTLQILFVGCGLAVLFNFRTRLMSGILGTTIILFLIGSMPAFRNHILICGCALLLASFHHKDETPFLLYYQLALVYFGAAINKVLQPDWWNGMYMHHWMTEILNNNLYTYANVNGSLLTAKMLSWFSMFLELLVAFLLCFKKYRPIAIKLILFFHLILFTVTRERFGHFLDSILLILIAFIAMPNSEIRVTIASKWKQLFKGLKFSIDWNSLLIIKITDSITSIWLLIAQDNRKRSNGPALAYTLLASSGFYVFIFVFDIFLRIIFDGNQQHLVQVICYWSLLLFFLWNTRKFKP